MAALVDDGQVCGTSVSALPMRPGTEVAIDGLGVLANRCG